METQSQKKLPTIKQYKYISKMNKKFFDCLGHSQNALAKTFGYKDYNAIKPMLRDNYIDRTKKTNPLSNFVIESEYDTPNITFDLSFTYQEEILNHIIGFKTLNIKHLYSDKLNKLKENLSKSFLEVKPTKKDIESVEDYYSAYGEEAKININLTMDDIRKDIQSFAEMSAYFAIQSFYDKIEKDELIIKYNGDINLFIEDVFKDTLDISNKEDYYKVCFDYYFYNNIEFEWLIKLYYLKYNQILFKE